MSQLDLRKAIFDKIEELGDRSASYFGITANTLAKWQSNSAQPGLSAAQKILDEALAGGVIQLPEGAPKQGATIPEANQPEVNVRQTAISDGNPDTRLVPSLQPPAPSLAPKKFGIFCPTNRPFAYATVLSLLAQWKATLPEDMRGQLATLHIQNDTLIHHARNLLADQFLKSGNEWSFWMDSDMICPTGNPGWFRKRTGFKHDEKFASYSAIERLTSHDKSFVGGVYCERAERRMLLIQPAMEPAHEGDKRLAEEIKKGPQDRIVPVSWLAFGCVAVHRRVFEDILASQPEVKSQKEGEPANFFTSIDGGAQGEDVAFAVRAMKAGHQPFLDLGLFCSHLGTAAFTP